MKTYLISASVVVAICLLAWLLFRQRNGGTGILPHQSMPLLSQPTPPSSQSAPQGSPARALKPYNRVIHQSERLSALEKAGQVPQNDHDLDDWQAAQHTSWWGKPLDPKEFWKGRILWNDESATLDAQRHGRQYPPMPYNNTNLPHYPNDDGIDESYSPDGPNISYAESAKEAAFWEEFDRTHPRPPDQIEHEQEIRADEFREKIPKIVTDRLAQVNYPPEAFTTNALFWTYVQMKRMEYQKLLASGDKTNEPVFKNLMSDLLVDRALISGPLTPEQIQAANAWEVAYLQRLRRESADEQYIQGYMQAWDLSSNEVFSSGN